LIPIILFQDLPENHISEWSLLYKDDDDDDDDDDYYYYYYFYMRQNNNFPDHRQPTLFS